MRELNVEGVQGDLRDRESLRRAVEGCEGVFHVAADYRLWVRDPQEMYRSNVDGTLALMEESRSAGVDRIVYTSTVGCIGLPPGRLGDEGTPVTLDDMSGVYKRSKFLAEQRVLRIAEEGLPVVVVNPTAPMGDHDWKPTPTGNIIVSFLRRKMPAYVDTGLNVVNVRDVAEGHLQAYEAGRAGERYILGGENLTLRQIFEKLEVITGVKAPGTQIPYAIAYAAGAVSTAWSNWTGSEPRAALDAVRMARKKMWVTHGKAERELGYRASPAEGALKQAVEWFRQNRYA